MIWNGYANKYRLTLLSQEKCTIDLLNFRMVLNELDTPDILQIILINKTEVYTV
jgi:hypothetical protein